MPIQCSPPIGLFEYKECLHIVYGSQVPTPAYVFVMKLLSIEGTPLYGISAFRVF